jgi:hypothetical protein
MARRFAEGKCKNEAMGFLERYVAPEVFHAPHPPRVTAKTLAAI